MPSSSASGGGDAQGGSRSTDLTRNLLATRTSLESHFNSFARRESDFRRTKLVLLDRQLGVQRQAANSEKRATSPTGGGPPRSLSRAGAEAIQRALERKAEEEDDFSGGGEGARASRPRPSRSQSSPGLLGTRTKTRTGSTSLADPPEAAETGGSSTFCVSRFGAQYPTSHHPAPHPGATTSRPHSRPVKPRRDASAPTLARANRRQSRAMISTAEPEELPAYEAPSPCDSPGGSLGGTLRLTMQEQDEVTFEPMSPTAAFATAPIHAIVGSPGRYRPTSSAPLPARRWTFATGPLDQSEENDPVLQQELELFAAEEKAFAELGCDTGIREPGHKDAPKTIERLGDFMTLLGPRYKTVQKQMLFQRSEVGDLGSFQRRLRREKHEAERGLHTGMAEHRVKMLGLTSASSEMLHRKKIRPEHSLPELLEDPDGAARAAWLNARAQEVERRARTSSNTFDSAVANPDQLLNKSLRLPAKKAL